MSFFYIFIKIITKIHNRKHAVCLGAVVVHWKFHVHICESFSDPYNWDVWNRTDSMERPMGEFSREEFLSVLTALT